MPVTTPVLVGGGETGIRLDEPFLAQKSAHSGGTQREVRWQVSTSNSFPAAAPALIFDSLLRAPNGIEIGVDSIEVQVGLRQPGLKEWAPSTLYYYSVLVRQTDDASSAWATAATLTTEAAAVSLSDFREAQ